MPRTALAEAVDFANAHNPGRWATERMMCNIAASFLF